MDYSNAMEVAVESGGVNELALVRYGENWHNLIGMAVGDDSVKENSPSHESVVSCEASADLDVFDAVKNGDLGAIIQLVEVRTYNILCAFVSSSIQSSN